MDERGLIWCLFGLVFCIFTIILVVIEFEPSWSIWFPIGGAVICVSGLLIEAKRVDSK
jgi:hypothetical protein